MKKILFSVMALFVVVSASAVELNANVESSNIVNATEVAEEETLTYSAEENNWGANLKTSPFGLGLDLQTKYMWRGMEMMTEEAAPVLFPSFNYSYKGLFLYAMGGYAINGNYAEVDLGASYTWNALTIGFNDYYYPTVDTNEDAYFTGGKHTGHWLEACITFAPEKVPVFATLSNFFAGADKYVNDKGKEKQAYSTYLEVGTYYDFLKGNRITATCGMALNKSCYNGYDKNFSICNVELKYTYNVEFKSSWTLPLSAAYIYNPVYDKSYINFTANLAF